MSAFFTTLITAPWLVHTCSGTPLLPLHQKKKIIQNKQSHPLCVWSDMGLSSKQWEYTITNAPWEKPKKHSHTHILSQSWRHKRIHKCHSQLAISLRTGGTLPPHHFRVLFITVWQHVSSSPRHYATLHWYSPTVQQPGTQHSHAKNMTMEE